MKHRNLILGTLLMAAVHSIQALAQANGNAEHGIPVCLTLPRVATGDNAPIINDFSKQLRKQLATNLSGPMVEPRGVDSRIALQARAESSKLKCHYLLNVNFTHKANSHIGRKSAEAAMAAGSVAQSFGGMSHGASGTLGAVSTLGNLLGGSGSHDSGAGFYPVGKNDHIDIAYSLELVDSTAVVKNATLSGKATRDNEPVADTLIEKLAGEIFQVVTQ